MPEFYIERLGALGEGVTQGRFARFALPGERIEGTPHGDRIEDIRVLDPVADRVKAPCRHFRSCGGCAVQHLNETGVAAWKEDIVRQALARVGLSPHFRPVQTSPPKSRRRATFTARRTKKGVHIGFHRHGSDQIVDLSECHVVHPDLMRALPGLAPLARALSSRTQGVRVSITLTQTGLDVGFKTGATQQDQSALALAQSIPDLARLCVNDSVWLQNARPMVELGPAQIELPPGAFLQATSQGQAALVSAVSEALSQCRQVADLFCGCGTFALPLAQMARVSAYEADDSMLSALEQGWRTTTGLKPLNVSRRNLFTNPLQPADLAQFDGVVIDPPRAGAQAQSQMLAKSEIARIAFVSCNPATFARDARILCDGGFELKWVVCVDQFRWSHHVELAALFERD